MPSIRLLTLLTLIATIAGCAPWSSYPPIETGGSILNPRFEPVPTLLSKSIRYVHQNYGTEGAYTFALPVGMADSLPLTLTNRLGSDASFTQNPAAASYRVIQVRSRGSEGEVDMTYRRADGQEQFVTVSLEKPLPLEPFRVVHAKSWRIRTDLLDDIYAMPEEIVEPVEPVDQSVATPPSGDRSGALPPTVPPVNDDEPGTNENG